MDAGTGFTNQVYELSPFFLHKVDSCACLYSYKIFTQKIDRLFVLNAQEWIMEQWEKNYYISSIAGANNGSSLVVMSKGTLL